jgi:hypothetical protein
MTDCTSSLFRVSNSKLLNSQLNLKSTVTSQNVMLATSQRSPASSVYPQNTSSSTFGSNASRVWHTIGLPHSQSGTNERQQRRMQAAGMPHATPTHTPSSLSTSHSSWTFQRSYQARSTICRDMHPARSSLEPGRPHPYSRLPTRALCDRSWARIQVRDWRNLENGRGLHRYTSRMIAWCARSRAENERNCTSLPSLREPFNTTPLLPVPGPQDHERLPLRHTV